LVATQGIAQGYDPVAVAAILRHADASTTMRVYASAIDQRQKDLVASIGATLALPKA
jgi:integrase